MGIILNCIKQSCPQITTFESNKHIINENALDFFGSYEDHCRSNTTPSRPQYAEMHPNTEVYFHKMMYTRSTIKVNSNIFLMVLDIYTKQVT